MSLSVGDKLGPYEILALIGKGGMGEVYRARDTRLNRDVAIKISAERFTERFEHEARAIAALNHSNICHLYDVGPDYLVMEMIEGPTLADRIQDSAIPLEEALAIARQVADALEGAHEKGIVHRDLKPGNIKIRPDGTVKVLDFGLAKMGGTPTVQGDHSPTMTIGQTEAGVILGTVSYMSPEQARGKPVDHRADIYAFGVVLYEMLIGKRLHRGETTTEVLASVIKDEPQWEKVPARMQRLLRRCLEKDPQKRLRHIGDVMALVDDAPAASAPVVAARPASRKWTWIGAGVAVIVAAAGAAVWYLRPAPDQPMLQLEITPPEGVKYVATITPFTLSPDGTRLAFLATDKDGKRMLWLRAINSGVAAALPGTDNAEVPFWSPDSRWVGFSANSKLLKIDVMSGGQPQVICEIQGRAGGTWSKDGVILFDQGRKPIQRVSATGGTPTSVFPLDAARGEVTHLAPYFLPDGQHFLYYTAGKTLDSKFASLDGKLNRVVLPGQGVPTFAPNPRGGGGWILYSLRGQLLARPFDPGKVEFTGQAALVADAVPSNRAWSPSNNGLLAFRHNYGAPNQITWVGRDGRDLGTVGGQGLFSGPRISPDQKTVVVERLNDQNFDIWTFDLTRNTFARFTFEPGRDMGPIWSSDGKSIIYWSERDSMPFVVERPANGIGGEKILLTESGAQPTSMSADGRWLVFRESSPVHSILIVRSREDSKKVFRIQERESELDGSVSPDGRWFLYSSVPSTRREVLVQSTPKEAGGPASAVGKWQISTAGGSQPAWRADGKEIFFVAPDGTMMAVPIEFGADFFRPGTPKPLFRTRLDFDPGRRQYDVTPDGQRFLLNQRLPDTGESPITVVVNWPKLLGK